VNIQRRLLRESFQADITLKWPLAGMNAIMNVKVGLATKGSRTLATLKRPSLDYGNREIRYKRDD
jgi:hypothetical protein